MSYQTDKLTYSTDYETKQRLLDQITEIVDGEYYFSPSGTLHFKKSLGYNRTTGVKFKVGWNISNITKTLDSELKGDTIYAIGAGSGSSRLIYITSGISGKEILMTNKNIESIEFLRSQAFNLKLARKNDYETYEFEIPEWINYQLGDSINVECSEINISGNYRIISKNLSYPPERLSLSLSNLKQYLLEKKLRAIQLLEAWQR
jgi:hypothetical protein